ncbi:MAG: hypothetical protein AAF447_12485 [Myxococcota bacterium]
MLREQKVLLIAVSGLALACGKRSAETEAPAPSAEPAAPVEAEAASLPFGSVTALAFADAETLLVADSHRGRVYAIPAASEARTDTGEAGETGEAGAAGFGLRDLDTRIAELLGTGPRQVRVRDLAVHPVTGEAYLAVARSGGEEVSSAVVIAPASGELRLLAAPEDAPSVALPGAAGEGFAFYGYFPSQSLTFTDLLVHDGKLYVAGLSHAEFDSTLWSTTLPLGEAVATTTVEIFHGIHDQQETRAPIRTMAVVEVDGADHLVAAYTCTPLVAFPLASIADGAHITGKTIGEMGYGNTPSDMLVYTTQDAQQQPLEVLFLQNADRSAQVLPVEAVREAVRGEGITEGVALTEDATLGASSMPMTNVLEVADQGPRHLAVLRRDAQEGDLELISYLKGVYFRLSDFQSEYEIPGYAYAEAQQPIRQFQNMMKVDEGYPDHVSE